MASGRRTVERSSPSTGGREALAVAMEVAIMEYRQGKGWDRASCPRDDPSPLTRLATLSGVSRGCKNSAVMSVSDWPEIWADAFDVPDGPGSKSLSSSSSPKLGSEKRREQGAGPLESSRTCAQAARWPSSSQNLQAAATEGARTSAAVCHVHKSAIGPQAPTCLPGSQFSPRTWQKAKTLYMITLNS